MSGTATGFPPFFLSALKAQYDEETRASILEGMCARRAVTLRVNTLKTDAVHVQKALSDAGIAFEAAPFSALALILPQAAEKEVWALPCYEKGEVYLQSLSSMLPPIALSPAAGADILDMAAAPGGKTTQIAAMTENKASITACEVNKIRADKLRFNLQKQGAGRVSVMVRDARKLEDFFRFDQILLDAPCSGSGTMLSQKPATLRSFSESLVKNSAALQSALLKKALALLKPGRSMIYSTCSILEEENECVVRGALKAGKAELEPIALPGMDALPLLPTPLEGAVLLRPTALYEGFFMARLVKR